MQEKQVLQIQFFVSFSNTYVTAAAEKYLCDNFHQACFSILRVKYDLLNHFKQFDRNNNFSLITSLLILMVKESTYFWLIILADSEFFMFFLTVLSSLYEYINLILMYQHFRFFALNLYLNFKYNLIIEYILESQIIDDFVMCFA